MEQHRHDTRPASPDAERAFIAQDTVWRALQALPPRRRAVIVLHELEGIDLNRFAALHPKAVRALAAGAINALPLYPLETYNGVARAGDGSMRRRTH
jgi:hypothetical protein